MDVLNSQPRDEENVHEQGGQTRVLLKKGKMVDGQNTEFEEHGLRARANAHMD